MGKPAALKLDLYTTALPAMKYDVVGVGELDVRIFKEIGKLPFEKTKLPQICANLINADNRKPMFSKPYIVKKMPTGLRVAIIGVIGTMNMNPQMAKQFGVEVLPPDETVRKILGQLEGKADLFVVLSHSGYYDAKKLAESVPGIDVVLSSHPSAVNTDFERVGETILMHCKGNGKYVGKLALDIDADGKIASAAGTQNFLDAKMEKDPEMQKLIDATEAKVQEYYQSGGSSSGTRPPGTPNTSQAGETYIGAQRCIGCHSAIHTSWKATKHAQAYDNLTKQDPNAKMNPDCLSCHTTGYGQNGGYRLQPETVYLRDVQCESCHGPDNGHHRQPSVKGYGKTNELTCRKCHDGANSPRFDYAKYREKILHPKP